MAAGRPIHSQELATLGMFRGRVETAWDYVQAYSVKHTAAPEVAKETDRIREIVFGQFEETRKSVYGAGLAGGNYPMKATDWFSRSTTAIDAVITLSVLASQDAAKVAKAAEQDAVWLLVLNSLLMALSFVLVCATFWLVLNRIVRSLRQMTHAMSALASGEHTTTIPCRERRDEMGSMAAALGSFKDSIIEADRLRAERGVQERRQQFSASRT